MRQLASWLLIFMGFLQMASALLNLTSLQMLTASWMCCPLPKVFGCSRGLETFSTNYRIYWKDIKGMQCHELSKQSINHLNGPHLRHIVIGALFSHGPSLYQNPKTKQLWVYAWHYYSYREKSLSLAIGAHGNLMVEFVPKKGQDVDLPLILQSDLIESSALHGDLDEIVANP